MATPTVCPSCGIQPDRRDEGDDFSINHAWFDCGAEWSNETGRAYWPGTCCYAMRALVALRTGATLAPSAAEQARDTLVAALQLALPRLEEGLLTEFEQSRIGAFEYPATDYTWEQCLAAVRDTNEVLAEFEDEACNEWVVAYRAAYLALTVPAPQTGAGASQAAPGGAGDDVNFGTLFSGGELAGVGIRAAGWEHAWGVEYDPAIAAVAQANGFGVTVADVLDCCPQSFAEVDAIHFSPPCKRASNSNQSAELNDDGTKEAPLDVAMGHKVAEFITKLRPRVVTVENVYAYRNFRAFKIICDALTAGGYLWNYSHENAADYGVPQDRKRLILRAVKVGRVQFGMKLPALPAPVPWMGWYEAIEDLLPSLPTSQFAPWQLARLPEGLSESMLVERHGAFRLHERGPQLRAIAEPVWTVRASERGSEMATAFIMAGAGNTNFADAEPGGGIPYAAAPAHTVTATDGGGTLPRAWLVDGQNATVEHGIPTARRDDEPSFTVSATQLAKGPARAWLSAGRVVAMTPRALARFQSVPDSYVLPEKAALACKVIGNGVPCLMMQRIYEGLKP